MSRKEGIENGEEPDDFGDAPAGSSGVRPHELPEIVLTPEDQAMIMKAILEEDDRVEITPSMREAIDSYWATAKTWWR